MRGILSEDVLWEPLDAIIAILIMIMLVQGWFWLARVIRKFTRRLVVTSADQLRQSDERRPILFLRSFQDDQISLRRARDP